MIKYSKIEFSVATFFFLLFLGLAFKAGSQEYSQAMRNNHTAGHDILAFLFANLQAVVITYGGFLALNYYVLPKFGFQKRYIEAIGFTLVVFIISGLSFMVFFSYANDWQYRHNDEYNANLNFAAMGFTMAGACIFGYAVFVIIREIIAYQYRLLQGKQDIRMRIIREIVFVFSTWLILLVPVLILNNTSLVRPFTPFFCFGLPCCFSLYFMNLYWLIPLYKKELLANGIVYALCLASIVCLLGLVEGFMYVQFRHYYFIRMITMFWLVPSLITIAISWWVFLTNEDTYRQLITLKTALGTSNANLQYLRAQINPHFLFNTLNALYGTALMEKADKTGEGIQKLGDMMRFMLHENNQDRIPLSRELEYLHNYIDLQNMRLALSPDMSIDVQIEDIVGYYEIAPMLLIPFIENAYKHGISLQERSWISVSLYKNGNALHLDVYNSVHHANGNDPEKFHSGTGLDNVKQRLQLLYPHRHELVVRQNIKEFFVHLTLTLTSQPL